MEKVKTLKEENLLQQVIMHKNVTEYGRFRTETEKNPNDDLFG